MRSITSCKDRRRARQVVLDLPELLEALSELVVGEGRQVGERRIVDDRAEPLDDRLLEVGSEMTRQAARGRLATGAVVGEDRRERREEIGDGTAGRRAVGSRR